MSFDRDLQTFFPCYEETKTDFQYLYKLIIPQQLFLSSELLSLTSKTQIPKPLLFLLFQKSSNSIGTEINNHKSFSSRMYHTYYQSVTKNTTLSNYSESSTGLHRERKFFQMHQQLQLTKKLSSSPIKSVVNLRLTLHQFTLNDGVILESY